MASLTEALRRMWSWRDRCEHPYAMPVYKKIGNVEQYIGMHCPRCGRDLDIPLRP